MDPLEQEIAGILDPSQALRRVLARAREQRIPLRWVSTRRSDPPEEVDASITSFLDAVLADTAAIIVGARVLPIRPSHRVRSLWSADAAERVLPIAEAYHEKNPWLRRAIDAVRAGDAKAA